MLLVVQAMLFVVQATLVHLKTSIDIATTYLLQFLPTEWVWSLIDHFNIESQYLYNYGYGIYFKKQQTNETKSRTWKDQIIFFWNNCTNINEFMISCMNSKPHVQKLFIADHEWD